MAVTPASDTYDRIGMDDALIVARQAVEDAYDGWSVSLTAEPDEGGYVRLRVDYAPTEH